MLIRFCVENFMSFNEEVELSMVASRYRSLPHHVIKREGSKDLRVLRTAVIYGPNAAGKSNLVKAIAFGKELITQGTKPNQIIPVTRFRLDNKCAKKPCKLQYDIRIGGRIYSYWFTVDGTQIYEELLVEIGKDKDNILFQRKTDKDKVKIIFSNELYKTAKERDFLDFVATGTRPNQLFLTESALRNVSRFLPVYHWFDTVLKIIFPNSPFIPLEAVVKNEASAKKQFLNYIQKFDTGVSDLQIKEGSLEDASIDEAMKEEIKDTLKDGDAALIRGLGGDRYTVIRDKHGKIIVLQLLTTHKMRDGIAEKPFKLSEESDGTQRMLDFIPILSDKQGQQNVYVIDEIDRSLHPNITEAFLDDFLNQQKTHLSQLIVTTHETHLLNFKLLRRDEIWFVDKNENGESLIFSMEEFKPRYDKDIRRGYLNGRFGAVPVLPKARVS
jgi:AAA15 family ATPase/GTPase